MTIQPLTGHTGRLSVSEFVVKDLDHSNGYCTLSIHLQNNSVKNKGYGTQTEILEVKYAFEELNMATVLADAILKNLLSRHVLRKAGFRATHQDDTFVYYRCDRNSWNQPDQ